MRSNPKDKTQSTAHLRRLTNNLFGNQSKGDAMPQEIESPLEDRLNESPTTVKYSRSSAEATPITVCRQAVEENFMFDSLDNQENAIAISSSKEGLEQEEERGTEFMQALQSAIYHFEKPVVVLREAKTAANKSRAGNGQSPTLSNFTTSNSFNERDEIADSLKKLYNELLERYNSLKASSKTLIKDYAILRSQFEEVNAVKGWVTVDEEHLCKRPEADEAAGLCRRV
eukprot:TRINITY_DN14476_c0_g1_i11.p1 TRINITY_DN14476_c0_g1~~TRINITY_DN14476_c0_g1_i11.p1  ORF type:complete len:228 (+),score=53.94 TRINITY_DN14476_c0_g1_i11:197-880(+)